MDGLKQWLLQLDFSFVYNAVLTLLSCLLCITLHEMAHGLVALALGDTTAKRMGRLSLNPLRHVDLMGMAMLALAGFGWAKPVPVDPRHFRSPKWGMALCALAGPVCNVLICVVSFVVQVLLMLLGYTTGSVGLGGFLSKLFALTATLSAGMAVFNLLPVPPLDGSKVLFSLLPDKAYRFVLRYERYGIILLAALVLTGVLDGFLVRGQILLLEWSRIAITYVYVLITVGL